MKRKQRNSKLTAEQLQYIQIKFTEDAKRMLSELKFKELVELYTDDTPFDNEAEHLIWVLTKKEIEKRNPQWLSENQIKR